MSPAEDPIPTPDLDHAPALPRRNVISLVAVLGVQTLNAFNDNFVKMLMIAFAGAVAPGTALGGHMQVYLATIFSIPYILFAPLAGWLSDRYSKRIVILWMQVLQVMVFGSFIMALCLHQAQLTLLSSLGGFFLLAAQAAFFSPAKMGVIKELVGSRRLGAASGALQMTLFLGVLSGAAMGGWLFGHRLDNNPDPWAAAWLPLWVIAGMAVAQIIGTLAMQRTPNHPDVPFQEGVLWEHFAHLRLFFSNRPIRLAGLGITYFWFLSNAISAILIGLGHEIHPGDAAGASKEFSAMAAMLGLGVISGSLLTSFICRRRIELGMLPPAGLGMAGAILSAGLTAHMGIWLYVSLVMVGVFGGCFMTPLYAFVQDRAKPDERARILSAVNLLDCISAIVANICLVEFMLWLDVPASTQLLVLVPLAVGAAIWVTRLLPRNVVTFALACMVRTLYRIRGRHQERLPKKGGLLLLPNHISYADALVLGAICDRDVRFVMIESLYKLPSIHWFLKFFGTVPISPTKAKEAIRTVADCLKRGECVCLFPEGQLSRTGFLNPLQRGFELMAKLGGAPLQPVWLDGLWGSIFSHERGRFFKKVPKAFPYQVSVWFGHPMNGAQAGITQVRSALMALSAEAFSERRIVRKIPPIKGGDGRLLPAGDAQVAQMNAVRLLETSLLHEHDVVVCLLPPEHPLAPTFFAALPAFRKLCVVARAAALPPSPHEYRRVIAVGERAALQDEASMGKAARSWDLAMMVVPWEGAAPVDHQVPEVYPAWYHAASGALLTLSVPDPEMPPGEEGLQIGRKKGSAGRVLPGIAATLETDAVLLQGVLPAQVADIRLEGAEVDNDGFLMRRAVV